MRRFWIGLTLLLFFSLSSLAQEQVEQETVSYPRLDLGGHIQLQLDGGGLGAARQEGGAPVRNGIGAFPTASRISPRRLRLYGNLDFAENVGIVTETDFEPDGFQQEDLAITPLDLFLKWEYAEGHHFRIGQAKIPFGYEFLRSSRTLTTVERSDTSRLYFQRDIGIGAYGEEGRFGYGVGVYQGQGENEPERNGGNDFVAKATYQVTPQLRFGASGHLGSIRLEGSPDDLAVRRVGLEAIYENGPWIIESEVVASDGFNLFSDAETPAFGYYLYAVRQLEESLDAVVGYDRLDPDTDQKNSIRSDTTMNARDRYTLGLNYYFSRDPIHRIMLNYEFRNELEGPSVSGSGVRLRYQFVW